MTCVCFTCPVCVSHALPLHVLLCVFFSSPGFTAPPESITLREQEPLIISQDEVLLVIIYGYGYII